MLKKPGPILLLTFLTFFVVSCPPEPESRDPSNHYPDLESYDIYAYDNSEPNGPGDNRNYYTVKAVQIGGGTYCNIWVDQTIWIPEEDRRNIIDKFDNHIKPRITEVFGAYDFLFEPDDGKVEIFLLDIKDGYEKNGSRSYVAGYFDARDLLAALPALAADYPYGNKARILYIDTYPNKPASELTYSTMAHELQHLISFCNSLKHRNSDQTLYEQDIWINEGLSSAAEYIYRGEHDRDRIDHFNQDPLNTIARGNNFFVWDETRLGKENTVLDDYASVYLFFQWLRLQSGGGNGIYTAIAQSAQWDYHAVTAAAAAHFDGADKNNFAHWQTLLETWLRANYVNSSTGREGYRGDGILKPRVWAIPAGTYPLYPGEAVYSKYSDKAPTPSNGIQYETITRAASNNPPYPYANGDTTRLLMFNTVADSRGAEASRRSGNLPGAGETKPASFTGRNAADKTNEPYAIDVWDLRGRRGRERPIIIQDLGFEK
jgi:hypothetical protein